MKMSKEMQEKRYNGGLERRDMIVKTRGVRLGQVRARLQDVERVQDKNLIEHFSQKCIEFEKDYLNSIKEREDYINKYKEFITTL